MDALQLHGGLNYSFALQHHTGQTTLLHILYNPKSEKVGTVWKTQIKKESSDF